MDSVIAWYEDRYMDSVIAWYEDRYMDSVIAWYDGQLLNHNCTSPLTRGEEKKRVGAYKCVWCGL